MIINPKPKNQKLILKKDKSKINKKNYSNKDYSHYHSDYFILITFLLLFLIITNHIFNYNLKIKFINLFIINIIIN